LVRCSASSIDHLGMRSLQTAKRRENPVMVA
jgi:hypothetical protein